MPLRDINILPSTYPHFDWADWPKSKSALVQGGLTAEFEKEAWNAIVDHVAAVLANSGLAWDGTYTTADGAKITEAYGALSAAMFNSVRHNIDHPAPLPWAWAKDRNFRGYVGYTNFRGAAAYGKNGDLVYPEYIEELTRRLNLLIAIATGEVALPFFHDYLAKTIIDVAAKAQHSSAVHSEDSASSIYVPQGIDVVFGESTGLVEYAESLYEISLLMRDTGAANLRRSTLKTDYSISARRRITLPASPIGSLGKSLHDSQIKRGIRKYISAPEKALSTLLVAMSASIPQFWEVTKEISTSGSFVTAGNLAPYPVIGSGIASSNDIGGILRDTAAGIRSRNPSPTLARALVELFDFGGSKYAARVISKVTSLVSNGDLRQAASLLMTAATNFGIVLGENVTSTIVPSASGIANEQGKIKFVGRVVAAQADNHTVTNTVEAVSEFNATAGVTKAAALPEALEIGSDVVASASDSHQITHEAQVGHTADVTAHSSDVAPTMLTQQTSDEVNAKAASSPTHDTMGSASVKFGESIEVRVPGAKYGKLRVRANTGISFKAASSPAAPETAIRKVIRLEGKQVINKVSSRGSIAAERAKHTVNAMFSNGALRQIEKLKTECRSGCRAVLSFNEIVGDWLYPVQTGNVLLIRQAYDASLDDNVLSIDSMVADWSYPVQADTTLLITQAYSANMNDTQLVLN